MGIEHWFDVRGKIALVTGGSRGIGQLIAQGLLQAGAKVYICARTVAALEKTAKELRAFGSCHAIPVDLTSSESVVELVAELSRRETKLDLLVNNAGVVAYANMEEISRDRFEEVLSLNLAAPFDLTRKLLPLLRASAKPDDPARVINIASVDALKVSRFESYPYCASKAGLVHLTRLIASRLASESITVNAIAPGLFRSEMTDFLWVNDKLDAAALNIPLRRAGELSDIAGAVIFLASKAGSYITGVTLPVTGGSATAQ
jgi:NAD(P)-dependent dehydrogenase (short-subunit alcohol dehydrogenase family)